MRYKKFIVFVIPDYYPSGGLEDIVGSSDDLDEAKAIGKKEARHETWYIVDRDTWEEVK